jgi:hypothetical protein
MTANCTYVYSEQKNLEEKEEQVIISDSKLSNPNVLIRGAQKTSVRMYREVGLTALPPHLAAC